LPVVLPELTVLDAALLILKFAGTALEFEQGMGSIVAFVNQFEDGQNIHNLSGKAAIQAKLHLLQGRMPSFQLLQG